MPILYLVEQLLGEDKDGPNVKGLMMFVMAVTVVPLIETLLGQALAHKVGQGLKLKSTYIILLSALWFGLMHFYSLQYIILTFTIGLVFAYAYYLYQSSFRKAFWFVAAIHALHNLTSVLIIYFFE
jgi:membrane protease YdiL (CAAX protease family)